LVEQGQWHHEYSPCMFINAKYGLNYKRKEDRHLNARPSHFRVTTTQYI